MTTASILAAAAAAYAAPATSPATQPSTCGMPPPCCWRSPQPSPTSEDTVADLTADEWNTRYPLARPEHPVYDGTRLETRTRSRAWQLGHGAPVVSVDGYSGGIYLLHVDLVGGDDRG